jgi:hypothetical protein
MKLSEQIQLHTKHLSDPTSWINLSKWVQCRRNIYICHNVYRVRCIVFHTVKYPTIMLFHTIKYGIIVYGLASADFFTSHWIAVENDICLDLALAVPSRYSGWLCLRLETDIIRRTIPEIIHLSCELNHCRFLPRSVKDVEKNGSMTYAEFIISSRGTKIIRIEDVIRYWN